MERKIKSEYDSLFDHRINNHVKNIIIYSKNDSWEKEQHYSDVTSEEHAIWKNLYELTYPKAYKYGVNIYRDGLDAYQASIDRFSSRIPNLDKISKAMSQETSWNIKPVSGFVDEVIFFDLISKCYFPSSDIIRLSQNFKDKYKDVEVKNNLSYTPEPDIFHEIFGHAPFLLNKEYCKLFEDIGKLAKDIIYNMDFPDELISHNLKRLQNFVWWTLEFGIIISHDLENFKILGAGILSSRDEIDNVVNSVLGVANNSEIIKYDIEKVVLTQFDYSNLQDRYYYIDSLNFLYNDFYTNKDIFLFKGN